MDRPAPEGDYAALGAQVIARSECGNYGEDALTVWKLPDGAVVIERAGKDGRSRRWQIAATDTLKVSADGWGHGAMVGVNTLLWLVPVTGEEVEISHFEFSFAWGGPHDDEVAELARKIAGEAGCTVTVIPMTVPDAWNQVIAAPIPVPPPEPVPIAPPAPPKALVRDAPGVALLGTLKAGNGGTAQVNALRLADGTVVIENDTTGELWPITRHDVLVIAPFAVGGRPMGVCTYLELRPRMGPEDRSLPKATTMADFYFWEDERKGVDEAAVAAFVATIAPIAACEVDHRAMVWD